jgi:hypothetical protein
MVSFWLIYLDLVEIFLGLMRADQEDGWFLLLDTYGKWCFAADETNYARYLSVYFLQMATLQGTLQELCNHFLNGGFSV